MKRLILLLLALLLVAGFAIITNTGSVFAQDDNGENGEPEFDPLTDNWCTNPDRWGDGRCNVEGDIWLTNWYYICGYYMARVESGEYVKGLDGQLVADGCLVPLPPPSPNAPESSGFPICLTLGSTISLLISGEGFLDNGQGFGSATCKGTPGGFITVVMEADPILALVACKNIDPQFVEAVLASPLWRICFTGP